MKVGSFPPVDEFPPEKEQNPDQKLRELLKNVKIKENSKIKKEREYQDLGEEKKGKDRKEKKRKEKKRRERERENDNWREGLKRERDGEVFGTQKIKSVICQWEWEGFRFVVSKAQGTILSLLTLFIGFFYLCFF